MKKSLLLLGILSAFAFNALLAAPPSYIQTKDGVIVFTDPAFTGRSNAVKLEVISDNIIRVTAAPGKEIVAAQSLVTIYSKKSDLSWNVVSSKETLTLKTKKLTAKWHAGGQKIVADAPYERMPVLVKTGSIIPFGPALQYTAEKPADTITINIYTGADASFNLYEDEGINYNYEKGAFSIIPIQYNEATKTVTVGDRKGGFNGMLQKRMFRINLITPGKTKQLDIDTFDRELLYDGKQIEVKL